MPEKKHRQLVAAIEQATIDGTRKIRDDVPFFRDRPFDREALRIFVFQTGGVVHHFGELTHWMHSALRALTGDVALFTHWLHMRQSEWNDWIKMQGYFGRTEAFKQNTTGRILKRHFETLMQFSCPEQVFDLIRSFDEILSCVAKRLQPLESDPAFPEFPLEWTQEHIQNTAERALHIRQFLSEAEAQSSDPETLIRDTELHIAYVTAGFHAFLNQSYPA